MYGPFLAVMLSRNVFAPLLATLDGETGELRFKF